MDISAVSSMIGVIAGILSSIISCAVGYGMMKSRVDRLENDISKCVSLDLFNATVGALREDLHEMKQDLRELLKTVQSQSK